ncbi:MAG TPA: NAD(P)-binding domain-containing protein [Gemmatimonadales bacterium]|nr:NAD(P)-binding domain-containing protein [Gemmatimonadales bacterium]
MRPPPLWDAVVVGAGPYGLSTAAHLLGRGLRVAVFGRTLEMWREHMPKGMLLRSHWWATNLSDSRQEHGFGRFLGEVKQEKYYPLPAQTFIDYALWFQRRAVPDVDETYVGSIARRDGRFLITLEDGREVASRHVVMAIGVRPYAYRPEQFSALPAGLVSHSSDHKDFSRFRGQDVVVIGGGQSAIEYAALLHEAGAAVQVVPRRPVVWLAPDRSNTRSTMERIMAPDASIAPGWVNWLWDRRPFLFYRFPQRWKDAYNATYHSGATDWLRHRVIDKVTLREGRTIVKLDAVRGRIEATLSDGAKLPADHIMLATGYRVEIDRLTMIHPALRAHIATDQAIPILSHWFESSVPGLYFVGLSSLRAFGPLYRFVAGCGAAARRVASAIARNGVGRSEPPPRRATLASTAAVER